MFTWKFYHFWYPSKSRVKIYKYGVYIMVQTNFGANYDWFDFQYNWKLGAIIITVHHYLQMSKVYIYWCRLMNFSIYYYIAWITAKLDNYCWKNCGGRRGEVMIFGFSSWSGTLLPFFSGAMYFTEWSLGVQFWSWIGLDSNFWSAGTFWKYK